MKMAFSQTKMDNAFLVQIVPEFQMDLPLKTLVVSVMETVPRVQIVPELQTDLLLKTYVVSVMDMVRHVQVIQSSVVRP